MSIEAISNNAMITTAHHDASQAGIEMLLSGGNAIDAAVAAAFALGVVDPHNTGIGGYGGFAICYLREEQRVIGVNFNTHAPLRHDSLSEPQPAGAASIAIPGVVDGLAHLLDSYGNKSFQEVLKPAIKTAEEGFTVSSTLERALRSRKLDEDIRQLYIRSGCSPRMGERICNVKYAETLSTLAINGPRCFYEGELARSMCDHIEKLGGILRLDDLSNYSATEFEPKICDFNEYQIYAPDSDSGGDLLRNIMCTTLQKQNHLCGESRSIDNLILRLKLLEDAWRTVRPFHHTHPPVSSNPQHTTHLCVVDEWMNVVSMTLTHGPRWFGAGIVIPQTGMVMNNGLSLFSLKPGAPNSYRSGNPPFVNMCPTLVMKDEHPFLVLGTPGGTRIPTTIANFLVDVLHFKQDVVTAIKLERFHAERSNEWWLEDNLYSALFQTPDVEIKKLRPEHFFGPMSCIFLQEGYKGMIGVTDPRFPGVSLGF